MCDAVMMDGNWIVREKKLFAALREQKERLEKLRERNQQLTEALRTTREELQHEVAFYSNVPVCPLQ